MKQLSKQFMLSAISIVLILYSCKKNDFQLTAPPPQPSSTVKNKTLYSNEVATTWFDLELQIIKNISLNPPEASRALGYTAVALYESLVPGMDGYETLKSKLGYAYTLPKINQSNNYYWPAVANGALKTIISKSFPSGNQSLISAHFNVQRNKYLNDATTTVIEQSEDYGAEVANIIFEWSKTDGYYDSHPVYQVPVFPGAWEGVNPLLPYWGNNRPFISSSVSENCLPSAPVHKFSILPASQFYKEAFEVYKAVKNATTEQLEIAHFWADGAGSVTPPGHNINIATQMIRLHNQDLQTAAIVYAKMGMAVTDAFIACWKGKYTYNLLRPVTYINKYIDPNWRTSIPTPPFPAYASGHSTVSSACAEVLTSFYGNIKFTDHTHSSNNKIRSFKNFHHAAEEAAISRLYGGIHYRMDNEVGLKKGKLIGDQIVKLKLTK